MRSLHALSLCLSSLCLCLPPSVPPTLHLSLLFPLCIQVKELLTEIEVKFDKQDFLESSLHELKSILDAMKPVAEKEVRVVFSRPLFSLCFVCLFLPSQERCVSCFERVEATTTTAAAAAAATAATT